MFRSISISSRSVHARLSKVHDNKVSCGKHETDMTRSHHRRSVSRRSSSSDQQYSFKSQTLPRRFSLQDVRLESNLINQYNTINNNNVDKEDYDDADDEDEGIGSAESLTSCESNSD